MESFFVFLNFYLFSFKDWTQSLECTSWLMHLSYNHSDIESSAGIFFFL